MKTHETIKKVAEMLRELEALGVKRQTYNLRSPWDRARPNESIFRPFWGR